MATAEDVMAAVENDDSARVADIVAAQPALANARNTAGVSAIMRSRYRGQRAVTDALLAVDPDLDAYEATSLGFADRLREVLDLEPALATAYSADGFTALHFAAFFGKAEAARTLLDAGALVDAYSRNELHVQPLHSAAAGRHHEVCRVLLTAGADVNAIQSDRYTPLHAAAQHGDDELVELFLSAGASPSARLSDGKTPADSAEAAGHLDVAQRIREVAAGG
jgi:uncharacterized protein